MSVTEKIYRALFEAKKGNRPLSHWILSDSCVSEVLREHDEHGTSTYQVAYEPGKYSTIFGLPVRRCRYDDNLKLIDTAGYTVAVIEVRA